MNLAADAFTDYFVVLFPFLCAVAMWFSIDLALLVRSGSGRRRRAQMRSTYEAAILAGERGCTKEGHPTCCVELPGEVYFATKSVLRRAVVMVGGDFARSPRMQYHATSLATCGRFDEVILIGFDAGNHLSEALTAIHDRATSAHLSTSYRIHRDAFGKERVSYDDVATHATPPPCLVSTKYLVHAPTAPRWFSYLFPLQQLHWVASTAYRVVALTFIFVWLVIRATAIRVNAQGQVLLTELILIQSPPAIPFVLLVQFVGRPLVWLYSSTLYYLILLPASWMSSESMAEVMAGRRKFRTARNTDSEGAAGRKTTSNTQVAAAATTPSGVGGPTSPTAMAPYWPLFAVDWHNYGFTILQAAHRPRYVVALYQFLETVLCCGDENITVSLAMQRSLQMRATQATGIMKWWMRPLREVCVLRDVAPHFFGPARANNAGASRSPNRRDAPSTPTSPQGFFPSGEAAEEWGLAPPPAWALESERGGFPARSAGIILIASTSWTDDDDYSMVIEALQRIDHRLLHAARYPSFTDVGSAGTNTPVATAHRVRDVWLLITGKGPARARFEAAVEQARLSSHVRVSTRYYQSYAQYSAALRAADVGLCLHHSSSGLDLPMKAVDMMGAGIPVMALRYPAMEELMGEVVAGEVSEDEGFSSCRYGWTFATATDLEGLLRRLTGVDGVGRRSSPDSVAAASGGWPDTHGASHDFIAQKRRDLRSWCLTAPRWEEHWSTVLLPRLLNALRVL